MKTVSPFKVRSFQSPRRLITLSFPLPSNPTYYYETCHHWEQRRSEIVASTADGNSKDEAYVIVISFTAIVLIKTFTGTKPYLVDTGVL